MSRFGVSSLQTIDDKVKGTIPLNTIKSKKSVWSQFSAFCHERGYTLTADSTDEQLADIMKDWAYNMKKTNGDDYKETVIKAMWNQTAKLLQDKYCREFNRKINPFADAVFGAARGARNAKRKALQCIPEKQKASAVALSDKNWSSMIDVWDEDTAEGLQKKIFMIVSVELAWRGGEGCMASIHHFREERANDGNATGRIEYNPIFTKTTQGGDKKLSGSKWLVENVEIPSKCPVRLFKKLREKRSEKISVDRLFLTPNPNWESPRGAGWYKNVPIGQNIIAKWVKESAKKAGLDVENKKITNHSSRATAVSNLAKSGIGEQQIMKITGHSNVNSIKPYLQLDQEHHEAILKKLRKNAPIEMNSMNNMPSTSSGVITNNDSGIITKNDSKKTCSNIYNNCTFYSTNLNMN